MSGYDDDLAYVHDVGFGDYATSAAPGLLHILHTAGIQDGRVIDLGCGGGIWASRLIEAGYEVIGVDLSPSMLAIARRRAPRATFHAASFLKFKPPRCRAVTALGEVFNYLFDPRNGAESLGRVCRRVFKALEPGGLLIFDLAEPARGGAIRQGFRSSPDWTCLYEHEYDRERQILTRHIVTFRKSGKKLFRRSEETHRLKLYPARDIALMLRGIGFRVRVVRGYGEFRLLKGLAGFVARKP